jgi:hypothetical protein
VNAQDGQGPHRRIRPQFHRPRRSRAQGHRRAVAAVRYLPVARCAVPRVKPARRCPPRVAPGATAFAGGGVRRTSRRSARSFGPSCSRSVKRFGLTVRKTGPRLGSTTATMTLELLGRSNTSPSSSALPSATFTRSPGSAAFIPISLGDGATGQHLSAAQNDAAADMARPNCARVSGVESPACLRSSCDLLLRARISPRR